MGNRAQIDYPQPLRRDISFLGRNGFGMTSGLDVMLLTVHGKAQDAYVMISPLTSKGDIARCRIDIPADPSTLRQIAAQFEEMAAEMDAMIADEVQAA